MVVNGEPACGGPCRQAWHPRVLRMMLRVKIRHVGSAWERSSGPHDRIIDGLLAYQDLDD